MTLIKRIAWVLLGIIVLIFVVSFFLPGTAHIQRTKVINAPTSTVYAIVNDLKTYDEWMPWNRIDTNMKKTYGATDVGTGASYSWTSTNKNVGTGKLTITESIPNQKVTTALDFGGMGTAYGGWVMAPKDSGTEVTWYMETKMTGGNFFSSVVGKYMCLFMDKMMGPQFVQGLDSLASVAERNKGPRPPIIRIDTMTTQPQTVLYIADSAASSNEISSKLAQIYGTELGAFMGKTGLKMTAPPMAWYSGDQFPLLFQAGVAVDKEPAKLEGRIHLRKMTGGPAVVAHFFGPYELDPQGYKALQNWLVANGKKPSGLPYEVYIGDPGVEKDPYKVQTDIIQPIH
jgi:ribosome-associated toxin RatA of RatAB toxin-antitoxin module